MKTNNLKIYCITHKYFQFLKKVNLQIIVGGAHYKKNTFPKNWLLDNRYKNISKKNFNFGTLTSIYWIWKNELKKYNKNDWVGICHYRRFWLKEKHNNKINIGNLKKNLLNSIPKNFKCDAIVASPQNLSGYKLSKILKKGGKNLIKNPLILFNKKLHTINLHFDMFHIYDGLKKASNLMKKNEKQKFLNYINSETEYYPFSIFILKKSKFEKLCSDTFKWIFKCENLFNKDSLEGYGQVRIFDFLAERYFSFWIKKNTTYKVLPVIYIDPKNRKDNRII